MGALLVLLLWATAIGFAQDATSKISGGKKQPSSKITINDIEAALKDVKESKDLDDAAKMRLTDIYKQAKSELEKAEVFEADAAKYKTWVKSATDDIADAKRKKAVPPKAYDMAAAKQLNLNELSKELSKLEQLRADKKKLLSEITEEPQRRVNRRTEISKELLNAETAVKETESKLQAIDSSKDSASVTAAAKTELTAKLQKEKAKIDALASERDAYEAQGELPQLQIDRLTAEVNQLEQDIQILNNWITEVRQTDAIAVKKQLEKELQSVPESLKQFVKSGLTQVNRRLELSEEIQTAVQTRDQVGKQLALWQKDFERTKQSTSLTANDNVGFLLVEKRAALPSSSDLKTKITDNEGKLGELQNELFKLQDRRAELSDIKALTQKTMSRLRNDGSSLSPGTKKSLEELFGTEIKILDPLIKDATRNYELRVASLEDQKKLLNLLKEHRDFIDTRIYWVQTAEPLGISDLSNAWHAITSFADIEIWKEVTVLLIANLRRHWILSIGFAGVLLLLVRYRRRTRRRLEELGKTASSISCRTIRPTMDALLLTLLLAAPWSILLYWLGLLLSGSANELVGGISNSLTALAVGFFIYCAAYYVCRSKGLAASHFGLSERTVSLMHRLLRVFILCVLPLSLFYRAFESQRDPAFRASIGRLCLIVFMLVVAAVLYRLFRRKDGVLAEKFDQSANEWRLRLHRVWFPLIVLIPLSLAGLAISGYQFAAFRLTLDLTRSFHLLFVLWIVGGLLFRSVRIQRRNIRWHQLTEGRQRSEEPGSEGADLEAEVLRAEKFDVVAMDQQLRLLISCVLFFVGIAGFAGIWLQDLPAISPIMERVLWIAEGLGGQPRPITIGDTLLAATFLIVAVVVSRNIVGLVDVLLLGRLGIESSTRYAISTLTQYAIMILGVLISCYYLGVSWSRAQWLIAALSVGLGFGLQEVVANFVCGIILLFERPIRIGDIVTLGDTTGVVVRIRSRATTVRNWDRQEVVIPNKELITGRIINWTLTDSLNRITIQVGIAYGSDTNRARQILAAIVKDNANVLDDPRPIITFEEFGDSTLNFILRAYLANIEQRLETIHQLHTEINQRFNDEGIEIAFPQRDLHLRSVDQSALEKYSI